MKGNLKKQGKANVNDYACVSAQERMVVDVQCSIQKLLNHRGWTQKDLAEALGVSESTVSQLFSDDARNLTLRRLAKIFHVLDDRCWLTSDVLEEIGNHIVTEGPNPSKMIDDKNSFVEKVMDVCNHSKTYWQSPNNENAMMSDEKAEAA